MEPQERALKAGVDIVVATPGRLLDHMRSRSVDFDKLEMLRARRSRPDDGHGLLARRPPIVAALPDSAARQTMLFSATMPEEVMRLADDARAPTRCSCRSDRAGGPAQTHHARSRACRRREKTEWLAKFLRRADGPALVFVRTKSGADRLARQLASLGPAGGGDARRPVAGAADAGRRGLPQRPLPVLVATDVAARGLDIDGITHVVNYEVPPQPRAPTCTASDGPAARRHRHGAHAGRRPRNCARCRRCSDRSGSSCRDDGRDEALRAGRRAAGPETPAEAAADPAPTPHRGTPSGCPRRLALAPAAPTRPRSKFDPPLASDPGRRRVLHASRRAAVCRQGGLQPRFVVPGVPFTSSGGRRRSASARLSY